ncbi:hypothetical protein [Geomonas anaerohicana]|uniref:Uncharacterized protein n=1 Tax=Geomonas anaerohicana TaxID=2798583 RepID=A0ABS0YGN3_9BACT|nr:hypothetical protein [Geomonas anaerohicana]MBJ6751084.1 hypothetical protein [Geomonas anaerohicana]
MGKGLNVCAVLVVGMAGLLAGCSAGGFQGPENNTGGGTAPNAVLKRVGGTASKGIIQNGNVEIYALASNGAVGARLGGTVTNGFGQYTTSVNITGAALFTVSGGSYLDEATGQPQTIPATAPLRAATTTVAGTMQVAITPLTELAVRAAGTPLIATRIDSANKLISKLFKVDILTTQPIAATASDFAEVGTGQEQKDYALALAAFSQMVRDYYGGNLDACLAAYGADLAGDSTLSPDLGQRFQSSLSAYLASPQNQTGVTDAAATNLANAGGGTMTLHLATAGTLAPGSSIYGITVRLAFPPGASVKVTDFAYRQTDALAVVASGVFPSDLYTMGVFQPASQTAPATLTVSIPQATGSPTGEFLTVVCDLPVGVSYLPSDFGVLWFKAVDKYGAEIAGLRVEIGQ